MEEDYTIVIADDDDIVRETVQQLLSHFGYTVHKAANGQEALDTVKRLRPDLVILDVNMPDLDGYTVLLLVKSQPLYRDLPIIVLTGDFVGEEYEKHSQALGALYHLRKPVEKEKLLSVVAEALGIESDE